MNRTRIERGRIEDLRGNETVLVVADGHTLRNALAGTLRQLGYRVLEAADASAAQRLAHAQRKVHLLLLDLDAPETADMELVLWFRAVYPETKVLIASNSLWELNLQLGTSKEIFLLAKPFKPHELARLMRRVLD